MRHDNPAQILSLPFERNLGNTLSMTATLPGETPRLLREWRLSHGPGFTQQMAADKLGVLLRNYNRWETGANHPRATTIERIAPIMGLEPEDFYAIEEGPTATRERIARIEEKIDWLIEAAAKRLTPAQKKALGPLPGDVAEIGTKRRSKRNGAVSGRGQALG